MRYTNAPPPTKLDLLKLGMPPLRTKLLPGGELNLASPLPANDKREDYLRATIEYREDGTVWTRPFKRQDSSMLTLLAKAQCLIIRAPHAPKADQGETVQVMRFPSGLANA